jgi:hypothetical protein
MKLGVDKVTNKLLVDNNACPLLVYRASVNLVSTICCIPLYLPSNSYM